MKSIKLWDKYQEGDILVSLKYVDDARNIGEMFVVDDFTKFSFRYKSGKVTDNVDTWRLATEMENIAYHRGIRNILEILEDNIYEIY